MLSIRTQDRMALVPYSNCTITILKGNCINQEEIETIEQENKVLLNEISANSQYVVPPLYIYNDDKKTIPNKIYNYQLNMFDLVLGTYETKERALEVLDEIEYWSEETTQILKHKQTYQMPKE